MKTQFLVNNSEELDKKGQAASVTIGLLDAFEGIFEALGREQDIVILPEIGVAEVLELAGQSCS